MTIKYERRPLAIRIDERTTIELPLRVFRVRLTGLMFETNKTFLLPGAMTGIRGLVHFYSSQPAMGVVITGHADRVGSASHNIALSQERALSMAHFLEDDVAAWLACYQGTPTSTAWGLREDQHMLASVSDDAGLPFYAGPVHGWLDQATRDAVSRFQASRGLSESGSPDEDTRRELVGAYMSLDGTTLPETANVERLGCGEHHNAVETADGVDEQANRRVEIFLFDGGTVEPPVPGTCPDTGCAYEAWLEATVDTIDFEDGRAELLVQVAGRRRGADLEVLADANVELVRNGFPTRSGTSDANGQVVFADLTSGTWSIHATKDGFDNDSREVQVHTGGFVLPEEQPGDEPGQTSNFAAGPTGSPASIGGAVLMQLKNDSFLVRWVDEPAITPAAQEKAYGWKEDSVHIQPNTSARVRTTDTDVDGVFVLPRGSSSSARVEEANKSGPHEIPVTWRVDVASKLQPGKLVDMRASSRLRMSVWAFYSPLIQQLWKADPDDVILHQPSIDAMGASQIDDLSLVHTIGWVEGSNPPRVDWKGFGPGGDKNRCTKYLRGLVNALHAKKVQVLAGWTTGDLKKSSSPYNQAWLKFLAAKETTHKKIDQLAKSAVAFFADKGIDIDGLGFDFEINGLSSAHAPKLKLLYQLTAKYFREYRADAFVTYANGPFVRDGEGYGDYANVHAFGVARNISNLVPRPMCYDGATAVPAKRIQDSVACALRKETSGLGGGLHPAQVQFALWVDKHKARGDFESLITETLRPNRMGLVLYRLPKQSGDPAHSLVDNTAVINFLKGCPKWNALLNPGEALPGTMGQPLHVPRRRDPGF